MHRKMPGALITAIIIIISVAHATPSDTADLSFDPFWYNRVIVYQLTGAYAPLPNEFHPTIIIYGDGTVIRKNGAYSFSAGKLSKGGVESIIRTLSEKGFFRLKKTSKEGPDGTGGRRFVLTVNLRKGSHQVWAEDSGGLRKSPENWAEIVKAVTQPSLPAWNEYMPSRLILVAHKGTAGVQSDNVQPWPFDSGDLIKASKAYPNGLIYEGSEAASVWKAFQKACRKTPYVVWKSGNSKFVDSVALPQLL